MTHHNTHFTIQHTDAGVFSGYLATPTQSNGVGIIMIQEIFGINASIREAADRFAEAGYTVLAPDLFWRFKPNIQLTYEGADLQEAFDYYHRFDVQQGVQDLGLAIEALKKHLTSDKVIALGFCLGGKMAYLCAAHYPITAAVAFYGGGIAGHLDLASSIHCPLLFHFGLKDEMITSDHVDAIRTAFEHRKDVKIEIYAEAGHAFYNHKRMQYHPASAELAHAKTLAFLESTSHA